jgi:hypothetical protein
MSRLFVPILVTASVAAAFLGCGRSLLEAPPGASGAAGRATGGAGQGAAGQGGGADFATGGFATGGFATGGFATGGFATGGLGGFSDLAGAGGFEIAGAGGGAFGGAGGGAFGGAGGGVPEGCVEGTNDCTGPFSVEFCIGGFWEKAECTLGCIDGVCAECMPGTSACVSDTAMQTCSDSGVLQPPVTCGGPCVDGACPSCPEGLTKCASAETQQTCVGGQWSPPAECTFICDGGSCRQNLKHVFVTLEAFRAGDIGGLTGADDICRTLALAAGLSSSYAAWLSTDTSSPAERFSRDAGPYVLVDGTIVANNWSDLTSGILRHTIDLTETGARSPTDRNGCAGGVWSDTSEMGDLVLVGATCGDWSDSTGTLSALGSTESRDHWSNFCVSSGGPECGAAWPLFCFEQ